MIIKRHLCALGFLVAFVAGTAGCSTNRTAAYQRAIEQNRPLNVDSIYKGEIEDKGLNLELYLLEKGRISQLKGEFEISRASFNKEVAILKTRELDDNTLPGADINVGSVLVNDNMLAYKARLFELEMVYLYQAYNYLALNDLEGALVEIRLAEFLLNEAEQAREREKFKEEYYRNTEAGVQKKIFDNETAIQKGTIKSQQASNQASTSASAADESNMLKSMTTPPALETQTSAKTLDNSQSTDTKVVSQEEAYRNKLQKISDKSFAQMAEVLAKTKSSVLNPYVVYVGGVIHEINGEFDDAYISYKKSLELMPSNPYLQREVVRMALKLDKSYDFDKLKASYPTIWKQMKEKTLSEDVGKLVVIYEEGWTPQKQQVLITLGAVSIAYPVYKFKWEEPKPMLVSSSLGEIGMTYPICYMGSLALRALQEEAKWRIIRQAARVAIKGGVYAAGVTMTAAGPNDNVRMAGIGVMIFSSIYNKLTENADLRCWMTLPENVQILVAELPSGVHKLDFAPQKTQSKLEKDVVVRKGEISLVWLVRVGEAFNCESLWPRVLKPSKSDLDDVKTHRADKL